MKLIIAGSREGIDEVDVFTAMQESGFDKRVSEIVSGTARGVDRMGEAWARENGIPVKRFPADWENNGRAAGHIRNRQMGDYADALLVLIYNNSRGSEGMLSYAKKKGLEIYVVRKSGDRIVESYKYEEPEV